MSVSFEIRAAAGSYSATIREGAFAGLVDPARDAVVLCDDYFAGAFQASGTRVIAIPAHESTKSLDQIPRVITALREAGVTRATTLIAAGGGVVQDVAGFVASIYMRGLPWDYAPTTLLAMVDSCIGGKSSINVGPYKNIVGTFHPPRAITIDPGLCATLSADQRAAGLCEAAKICFVRSPEVFQAYLGLEADVDSQPRALADVIALSLEAKKWFIETDEFDQAERLLLNYGHTYGHAIESASGFRISHGVAVGLGMLAAGSLSRSLGRVHDPDSPVGRLESHVAGLLCGVPELGNLVRDLAVDPLMDAFRSDKKHTRDAFAVVVPRSEGGVERLLVPRDRSAERRIEKSFLSLTERSFL